MEILLQSQYFSILRLTFYVDAITISLIQYTEADSMEMLLQSQ